MLNPNAINWREQVLITDIEKIRNLVSVVNVFSPEEIAVAGELVIERLKEPMQTTHSYRFLFAESAGRMLGYTCFGQIYFTNQRYDLYWIAVHPDYQQYGIGNSLIQHTEEIIKDLGGVVIYAATSSRDIYNPAQQFYERCAYVKVAELKDFYRDGDNKIIYHKRL